MHRTREGKGRRCRISINWRALARHIVFAIVCGILCAFASILLCLCVDGVRGVFGQAHWLLWLLPLAGVCELLLYSWWDLGENLTTRMVITNMRAGKPISILLFPGILLGTCMSILAGGCVGKEAGALQMGASIGSTLGKRAKLTSIIKHGNAQVDDMNRYAASVGMASAFSALFFAPLGSCFLVLELLRYTEIQNILTILLGCFVAAAISRHFGIGDVIEQVHLPQMDWKIIGACIVIAVATAIGGSLLSTAITMTQSVTSRISKHYVIWVILAGLGYAVLVHVCGWYRFTGTGGDLMNNILAVPQVSWDFLIKMLLMVICLGCWFKGGEIMPSLCIGAMMGAACSVMTGADPCFGAALGSMSFLAAFHRCPLSAFFMGCEIFGWSMAPYLVVAIAVASIFGYPVGIYGAGFRYFVSRDRSDSLGGLRYRELDDKIIEGRGPFDTALQIVGIFKQLTTPAEQDSGDSVKQAKPRDDT